MNEILKICLHSQFITNDEQPDSTEVVKQLAGIQAQNEGGARWSIGLRIPGSTEKEITQSIANCEILRAWLFRGTLHYAAREELSWLLKLLAPSVVRSNARRYEQLGLCSEDFAKSHSVISKLLQSNQETSRGELKKALQTAGIPAEGQRLPSLLQRAALDGWIYISGMRGREMTFRLISEMDLPILDLDRLIVEADRALFSQPWPDYDSRLRLVVRLDHERSARRSGGLCRNQRNVLKREYLLVP